MKQKTWIYGLVAALVCALLLAGCGDPLEKKIAAVQKANTITVEDVVTLLELEGLTVEQQQLDSAFAEKWPNAALYLLNEKDLLVLESFDVGLGQREKQLEEVGWYDNPLGAEIVEAAISQRQDNEMEQERERWWPKFYQGKNVVAWCVALNDLDDEAVANQSVSGEDMETVSKSIEIMQKVFNTDINNMQSETFEADTEHFHVQLAIDSYQTPLITTVSERKSTEYDCRLYANATVQMTDEVFTEYEGQPFSISVKGPCDWSYGNTHEANQSGDLSHRDYAISLGDKHFIGWEVWDIPIRYEVTITVGDLTETVELGQPLKQQAK